MSKSYLYLCACACTCTSSWYLVPCTFCACLLPLLLCACAYGNIYGILRFTVYGLRFTVYTVPCTSTVYLYTLYVLIGTYAVRSNEHYNKAQHNSSTHETVEQSRFPTREWSRCYTENFLFWPLQITRIQTWFHANDSTTSAIMNVCYSHGGTDVHNSDCEWISSILTGTSS